MYSEACLKMDPGFYNKFLAFSKTTIHLCCSLKNKILTACSKAIYRNRVLQWKTGSIRGQAEFEKGSLFKRGTMSPLGKCQHSMWVRLNLVTSNGTGFNHKHQMTLGHNMFSSVDATWYTLHISLLNRDSSGPEHWGEEATIHTYLCAAHSCTPTNSAAVPWDRNPSISTIRSTGSRINLHQDWIKPQTSIKNWAHDLPNPS